MRLITKRIKMIEMSEEEVAKFHDCMERASQGHTSHYAEEQLDDGSYLGVAVLTPAQVREREEERQMRRNPDYRG